MKSSLRLPIAPVNRLYSTELRVRLFRGRKSKTYSVSRKLKKSRNRPTAPGFTLSGMPARWVFRLRPERVEALIAVCINHDALKKDRNIAAREDDGICDEPETALVKPTAQQTQFRLLGS
jgi:hypothetical protein